jgi:heme-degrading monooxygenase HmoA
VTAGYHSILLVPVIPERHAEFVRRFAELRIFELAGERAGLRAARLLRPDAQDEPFIVVAEWDTAEAYRGWLTHPERARVNAELTPLLGGELHGGLYVAAESWGSAT